MRQIGVLPIQNGQAAFELDLWIIQLYEQEPGSLMTHIGLGCTWKGGSGGWRGAVQIKNINNCQSPSGTIYYNYYEENNINTLFVSNSLDGLSFLFPKLLLKYYGCAPRVVYQGYGLEHIRHMEAVAIIHHVTIENNSDIEYKNVKVRVRYSSLSTMGPGVIVSQEVGVLPVTLPPRSKQTYLTKGHTLGAGSTFMNAVDLQVLSATPVLN